MQLKALQGRDATSGEGLAAFGLEVVRGFRDTLLLAQVRWRGIKDPLAKSGIFVGFLFMFLLFAATINLGFAVRILAEQGEATAGGIFAVSWIMSIQSNYLGDVGAITLGGALVAAVFSPFTGSSTLSLSPTEDLQGLRLSRLHKFFDSLFINSISGIGILQLFALTAITSVLTLDGNRGPAMLITWAVWFSVIILTTTMGWMLEYVLRRWGSRVKWQIGIFGAAIVIIAILLDPSRGFTVFGLGNLYGKTISNAASGDILGFVYPLLVVTVISVGLGIVGLLFTRVSLLYPAPTVDQGKNRITRKMPKSSIGIATRVIVDAIWRTGEARRPILAVVVVGIPGLMITEMNQNLETAVLLAVPLASALAWCVNSYGLIGPGMTWLSSQPKVLKHFPRAIVFIQLLIVILLTSVLWLGAFATGKATSEIGLRLITGAIITGALSGVLSVYLSTAKPIRARLSGRGDALVPPLTALNYLLRLLVFVCLPAAIIATSSSTWIRVAGIVAALAIAELGTLIITRYWSSPAVKARVVAKVSAN